MSTLTVIADRPSDLTNQVAAEVRAHMARVRMSQVKLAEILGLPQTSVSKRLRGITPFRIDELGTVAAALGVHPAALLGGNPPSPNGPLIGAYRGKSNTLRDGNVLTLPVRSAGLGEVPDAMRGGRPAAA